MSRSMRCAGMCVAVILLGCGAALGDFIELETFDDLNTGNLNGQGDWTAINGLHTVTADPAGGSDGDQVAAGADQVFHHGVGSGNQSADYLLSSSITAGTSTLFMQLYVSDSTQQNMSFGFHAGGGSNGYENFRTMLRLNDDGEFDLRNGGDFQDITNYTITTGTWYNVWTVADEDDGTWAAYVQAEGETSATKLKIENDTIDTFDFRYTGDDIDRVRIYSYNSPNERLYFDNIFLDSSGENLSNPVPEPATMSLLALGGLGALLRRRK